MINKKILVIIVILLAILFVIFMLIFSLGGSAMNYSRNYKRIATENQLAKDSDFKKESNDKDADENIKKSIGLVKNALLLKASITGYDKNTLDKDFDEVSKKVSKKKYENSLELIQKSIDKVNASIESYKKSSEKDLSDIRKILGINDESKAIVTNQKIVGDWASVSITLPGGYIFGQKRFLKKENGKWKEILPDIQAKKSVIDVLKSQGAPSEIVDSAKGISASEDILKPIKY
ncbi:MAG: hypothetical protein Q7S53_00325 [bacterium]|nr:hypothetical protein [bacterium]